MTDIQQLEERLCDFDPAERRRALAELLSLPDGHSAAGHNVNMHCHSFFSFNALGWSPARVAWEARKRGFYAAGLCDFDVLDGQEEFIAAGDALGLRTAVHLETRAFVTEFADREIDSPGEPGVSYIMGGGFARALPEGSPAAQTLAEYRQKARERNEALIGRINAHLPEIAVDYAKDVLILTPGGTATERHIMRAYLNKSRTVFADDAALVGYWAKVLGKNEEQVKVLLADPPAMDEQVRNKLAKRGGVGYVQPSADTFPPAEDFFSWVRTCGAIPMDSWLDGISTGEATGADLMDCMRAKGAAALNLIPDRNWNIADSATKARKQANLAKIIKLATDRAMPLNIGTEMNKLGLPMVDELDGGALRPFKEVFLRGAQIMVGHMIALRFAGLGYASNAASVEFSDIHRRNWFFAAVGALPALQAGQVSKLAAMGSHQAYACLHDSVKADMWKL